MILCCSTYGFAQAPDAVTYAGTGGQQFFTIANNTNGLGFSESGWSIAVTNSSGTINTALNFTAATFSNGTVTGSNDSATPVTNDYVIAATTTGSFISGAAGSGLNIQPGAANLEADNNLVFSTFINFTNPVFAFGLDIVDIFDHGGGAYTDTWEIFLDGNLVYRIGPNLAIGAGATGTFQIFDGAGTALGNIIAGENTEIFFGFTSPTEVSGIEIRRNSVFGGGTTTGEDFHGIDSFRFVTVLDSDGDGNPNDMDPNPATPTAVNDMASVNDGSSVVIDILDNDDYLDNNDTDNLGNTTIADTGGGTAGGTISFDADTGELTYTPLTSEAGSTVTVEYQVCNDVAPLNPPPAVPGAEDTCTTATVSITVNSVVMDTDGDGVPDAMDACPGFDDSVDNDGDGVPDQCDFDDDNDGIPDLIECPDVTLNSSVLINAINNGTVTVVEGGASGTPSVMDAGPGNDELGLRYIDQALGITYYQLDLGGRDFSRLDGRTVNFRLFIEDLASTNTWFSSLLNGAPDFRLVGNGGNIIEAQILEAPYEDATAAGQPGTFSISYVINQANFTGIPAAYDAILADLEAIQIRGEFWGGAAGIVESELIPFLLPVVPDCDDDMDGVPNIFDLDSDNDGIYDVIEAGNGGLDTNGDGVVDSNDTGFSDSDGNGADDTAEATIPTDTGNDNSFDFLNTDSDGDGCPDANEAYNDPDAAGSDGGQFGDGVPASVDATTGLVTETGVDYTTGTTSAVTDDTISEACCTVEAPALSPN